MFSYPILTVGTVVVLTSTIAHAAESLEHLEKRLQNELAFEKRIENRIKEAESALSTASKKAQKDLQEAYYYAEAASKIANFGVSLVDEAPTTETPVDDAVTFWGAATAASAVERLKKAVDKLRSYEEFTLMFANGDYQKEINSLRTKLSAYEKRNIIPLQRSILERKIVGTWEAKDDDGKNFTTVTFSADRRGVREMPKRKQSDGKWIYNGQVWNHPFKWWINPRYDVSVGVDFDDPKAPSVGYMFDGTSFRSKTMTFRRIK